MSKIKILSAYVNESLNQYMVKGADLEQSFVMKRTEYLSFVKIREDGGKHIIGVGANNGKMMGFIKWHKDRYAFASMYMSVMDMQCLQDIVDFIKTL